MFGFLLTPAAKIIGIVLIVAGVFGFGYYKGNSYQKEKFDAYKIEVSAAAKAQEEETKRIIKTQQQITAKAEKRHEKDISSLRAIYDRMRRTSGSGTLSTAPDPAKDPSQATAYYLDVAPELAIQCGETTQQLVSLQNWVNDQSQVKE